MIVHFDNSTISMIINDFMYDQMGILMGISIGISNGIGDFNSELELYFIYKA